MSDKSPSPTLDDLRASLRSVPHHHYVMIFVTDVERSVEFYRDKLGFTLARPAGGGLAKLDFGLAKLYLYQDAAQSEPARPHRDAILAFNPGDVDAYYAAVQAKGVPFAKDLGDEPWGDRDFSVKDPDGYELWFVNSAK